MLVLPSPEAIDFEERFLGSRGMASPREAMAKRLPAALQPFLTWLTAKPAPGEEAGQRSPISFVLGALAWIFGGCALTALPFLLDEPMALAWLAIPLGLTATCCGLGLFQVVIFHHCSHGTVFATRETNRRVGRLISALLLFKRFEDYQREHMLHHSAKKLLTVEDEFAEFVLGLCGLEAGLPKRELWRRVIVNCVSPVFHARFLIRRVQASLFTGDAAHDWPGRVAWALAITLSLATGTFWLFLLVWVLPVTVLLQIATIFRILVEHSFPEAELIAQRDKEFVCHASVGVFPGREPPVETAGSLRGLLAWTGWWAEMLTVHLFVRLFVMVGDAPCHDYHHRRPATRRWTSYIHARQQDLESGSPGFPTGYFETWGLLRAVDRMLGTLAVTAPATLGREKSAQRGVAVEPVFGPAVQQA
ncbi:MAG: fatty acid desaturase [Variibacter sp.]|nr:fatty acid desaturase [Variibacter sp.]